MSDIISLKCCTRCKQEFPKTEEYFRFRKFRGSFFSKCRKCERERDAELRAENAEKRRATQKRFRLRHPERSKEIKKSWAIKNKSRIVAKGAKYYLENYVVMREKNRLYESHHPEKKRARGEKRRALIRNAEGFHTSDDLKCLYQEHEGVCGYCGVRIYWSVSRDIHIDHIQPLSKGGSNWPQNIILACETCNLNKGIKTLDEWIESRGW